MKRLSTVLLFIALWAMPSWAASSVITTSGTTCIPATNCLVVGLPQDKGGATLTLSGTWTGTIQFEATGDSITWTAVSVTPLASTTTATSTTSNGVWQVNTAGFTGLRMRASAAVTGAATATITFSYASARAAPPQAGSPGGGNVTGTFTTNVIPKGTGTHTLGDSVVHDFSAAPTTGDLVSCTTAAGLCTLTDAGGPLPANTPAVTNQWLYSYNSATGAFGQAQITLGNLGVGTASVALATTTNITAETTVASAIANSPNLILGGVYEATAGPTYGADLWTVDDVVGAGVNGTSTLTFAQSGSSGAASVSLPAVVVGSPTGGDKGVGTLNATGVYVNGTAVAAAPTGVAPIAVTAGAVSLQNSTPVNITASLGTDTEIFTASGSAATQYHLIFGDASGGIYDPGYGLAGASITSLGQGVNTGTGLNGTFVGQGSGKSGATGYYNTAFGSQALYGLTSGGGNSALGYGACGGVLSGNYNACIGYTSGGAGVDGVPIGSANTFYVGSSGGPLTSWYFPTGITNTSTPATAIWHLTSIVTTNDTAGGSWNLQLGKGTGIGTPSIGQIDGPVIGTTGATAQTEVNRLTLNDTKSLINGAAATVLTIPLATLQSTGGEVHYTIRAFDGTNSCVLAGGITYAGENSAGVYVLAPTTGAGANEATACTAAGGTLTDLWALVSGTNSVTLQVTPTLSTMTPTVFRITYTILHGGMTQPSAF